MSAVRGKGNSHLIADACVAAGDQCSLQHVRGRRRATARQAMRNELHASLHTPLQANRRAFPVRSGSCSAVHFD